jgi:Domain of unknown function (DUF4149)
MVAYLNFHVMAAFLNAISLGAMLFFAVVVTPVVFKTLTGEARTSFLSTIFPVYYRSLLLLNVLGGLLIIYRVEGWILLIIAAGFSFSDMILRPQIDRHRPGHYAGETNASGKFKRLHRISVLINLAQMIASLTIFFRLAV